MNVKAWQRAELALLVFIAWLLFDWLIVNGGHIPPMPTEPPLFPWE